MSQKLSAGGLSGLRTFDIGYFLGTDVQCLEKLFKLRNG